VVNLRWIRGGSLPSIFGAVFEVHFCTLFGLRSVYDLLVLRDFLDFEVPFGPSLPAAVQYLGRYFTHPHLKMHASIQFEMPKLHKPVKWGLSTRGLDLIEGLLSPICPLFATYALFINYILAASSSYIQVFSVRRPLKNRSRVYQRWPTQFTSPIHS
jgi:hypothetical protein